MLDQLDYSEEELTRGLLNLEKASDVTESVFRRLDTLYSLD